MTRFFGIVDPPAEPHFRGYRTSGGTIIVRTVPGDVLNPRFDLWNHSPDGFNWGYGGSGPAQLSLAMLAHVAGDDNLAVKLHQQFKADVVCGLDHEGWYLTLSAVRAWIFAAAVTLPPEERGQE
jgi:hypothetical protein